MRHRRRAAIALGCAFLVAARSAAMAQDYPPGGARLTVQDADGDDAFAPGETGTASATNLTADTGYLLDFDQGERQPVGEGRTDAAGAISFTFAIPASSRSGSATLIAHPFGGTGSEVTAAIQIGEPGTARSRSAEPNVSPPSPAETQASDQRTGGGLPRSGVAIALYVALALALLTAGMLLLAVARRRALMATSHGSAPSRSRWSRRLE